MKISDNEILVEKEIHRIIDFIYNRKQQFERSSGSKLNINLAKKMTLYLLNNSFTAFCEPVYKHILHKFCTLNAVQSGRSYGNFLKDLQTSLSNANHLKLNENLNSIFLLSTWFLSSHQWNSTIQNKFILRFSPHKKYRPMAFYMYI